MSYDVCLYTKEFLKRALAKGLGDWTGALPIPRPKIDGAIAAARAEGFEPVATSSGAKTAELVLDSDVVVATLSIFSGEIAFTIPYGPRAEASIELCRRLAQQIAAEHDLGLWDPQVGDEVDVSVWLEALKSGDPELRVEAAARINGLDPRTVPALAAAARHDAVEDVRRTALESLGALGDLAAGAFEDVMECLVDPNPIIQYWAAFALGRMGPVAVRALPALERLSASPEHGPRSGALDAIRAIRERESRQG